MADEKQETIEDVVRKMRNEIAELRKVSPNVPSIAADWWEARADEIEAAHKRELSKNTSKNGADFGQLGDAAKLREAVGYILKYADCAACRDHDEHTRHYIDQIRKWAQAALAAPARNCDRPECATLEMATKTWIQEEFGPYCNNNCNNSKVTMADIRTFEVWIYAHATEKEGGAK